MKKLLIISFDLIRDGEPSVSLSIASILSYLKSRKTYGLEFIVEHYSFNMFDIYPLNIDAYTGTLQLNEIDSIALSCYVWNESIINQFIAKVKGLGFKGKVILGGYQVSYSSKIKLRYEYPECDVFIFGYAESSMLEAILIDKPKNPIFLNKSINFEDIPSVYLTEEVPVVKNQGMLRLETKRGCPYKCSFCAHRDLIKNKVYNHEQEKIIKELLFFKEKNVGRINVLDPIFNMGAYYLGYLREIYDIDLKSKVCLQARFEIIKGDAGSEFLDASEKINSHLEFGIQTLIPEEYKVIKRINNKKVISGVIRELNERGISYEVSLIYGLPNQTLDSFRYNIDFLQSIGCFNITAYPLMLLKGTELYDKKYFYNFVEKEVGDFNIPTVVSSNSFTEKEWLEMKRIGNTLQTSNRL